MFCWQTSTCGTVWWPMRISLYLIASGDILIYRTMTHVRMVLSVNARCTENNDSKISLFYRLPATATCNTVWRDSCKDIITSKLLWP